MKKLQTEVKHSHSKSAWNVVSTQLGSHYKIARVPYLTLSDEKLTHLQRQEALERAEFISYCFNHYESILLFKKLGELV